MRTPEELLRDTEPFPASVIKKLPPRGDNYVPWTHYAQRLLLHHGGFDWIPGDPVHAITRHIRQDGEIIEQSVWAVRGELHLDDEVYGAVGEDDAPSAAESNAFKRACAKAGIGLHLYENYWLHGRLGGSKTNPVDEAVGGQSPSSSVTQSDSQTAPHPAEYDDANPRCPDCNGPVYDNRNENDARKAEGKKAMPSFKCMRKDECGWLVWNDPWFFAEDGTIREEFDPADVSMIDDIGDPERAF